METMQETLDSLHQIVCRHITAKDGPTTISLLDFVLEMRAGISPGTINKTVVQELWVNRIRSKAIYFEFINKVTAEFRLRNELVDEAWETFCKKVTCAISYDYEPPKRTDVYYEQGKYPLLVDNVLRNQLQSRPEIESYLIGNPWLTVLILFTMLPPDIKPLRKYAPEESNAD